MMDRRSVLVASIVGTAIGMVACAMPLAQPPAGAMKTSVLFAPPTDPVAFDKYYFEQHMPLTRDVKGVRFETSKVQPGASGAAPAFYRLTEIYFESPEHMRAALSSSELKKVFQDAQKFQPPGTTVLISRIE